MRSNKESEIKPMTHYKSQITIARIDNTILLVDDEEDIRDVLGMYLTDMGYNVLTAENGGEGLRIFREKNPPIVLSDIKMPGMDGIALLQQIKRESPNTEVIMITGHGDMELAIRGLKYEATDFITKPINDDILEIALRRAHEKLSMRRQIREHTENLEKLVKEQSEKLVQTERLAAVGQAVEGLSEALSGIADDLDVIGMGFFNEMPCFVSVHNRNLKVVEANALYKTRLGKGIGNNSFDIYRREEGETAPCPVEETFQTEKGERTREIIRYADGNEIPVIVHTAPIRNRDGNVELVLEIAADLAEIQRLREELRTTEQRYQQLFDEVPCYISVQDSEFKITAANRQFKEDFGDGIGEYCYEFYKHRKKACTECPVAQTFEDYQIHQSETVVTSKSGGQINVLIQSAPLKDTSGKITQVMEISTNITQIRKLQDRLSSLGLLIGSVSHSIKGLLTGLDGSMYMMNSGLKKEDRKKINEGWEDITRIIRRIRKMVLDILYYAKEDRNLQLEKTDILCFAHELAKSVEFKINKYHIQFIKDFKITRNTFEIDCDLAGSALINILENAVDACADDRTKSSYTIIFRVTQDNTHTIFDVMDNGMGMDTETREKMFTLFFSSKGSHGTGLGLFISDQIIKQHGGTITITSESGKGSHFCVKIPHLIPFTSLQKQRT